MTFLLNGFSLEFSKESFTAFVRDISDNSTMKELRQDAGDEWFLYWHDRKIYGIPKVTNPKFLIGEEKQCKCDEYNSLKILSARIDDCLPERFPKYEAFRRRPFAFLAQKDELVNAIIKDWPNIPPIIEGFKIRPKFELEPRIIEFKDDHTQIGLFMEVGMRWEIAANLEALVDVGIDLKGLYIVRRNPGVGERRLVGRITTVANGIVNLSEGYENIKEIPVMAVNLE